MKYGKIEATELKKTWDTVLSDATATPGKGYMLNAVSNPASLTLPDNPNVGDTVEFKILNDDNGASIKSVNELIEGLTDDYVPAVVDSAGTFVYTGASKGWSTTSENKSSSAWSLGAYRSDVAYEVSDMVSFDGVLYKCLTACEGLSPDIYPSHWDEYGTVDSVATQELHKVTSAEVTQGYFTLINPIADDDTVRVTKSGEYRKINKLTVGSTGVTPDFTIMDGKVYINDSGTATGLSGNIVADDVIIVDYAMTNTGQTFYTLTVVNGVGGGEYPVSATPGITADDPQTGYEFDAWTGDVASVNDVNAASTSLIMPSSNISVTATFKLMQVLRTYGYTSGGNITGGSAVNVIDKFTFATDGDATDVGDLTTTRYAAAGQSSTDHGYVSGGADGGGSNLSSIDKFTFATDGNAAVIGNLPSSKFHTAGQSSSDYGYTSGDDVVITKFSFSADGDAAFVGNLTVGRSSLAGQSSTDYGYNSGGFTTEGNPYLDVIDKFSFATDGDAADVGNLTVARYNVAGQSSPDYGYTSGGDDGNGAVNIIDKFSFASDGNAADVGDLTVARYNVSGQSSSDYGYTSGGNDGTNFLDVIDKFSFTTDGDAADVGNLTVARDSTAGQQY